MGNIAFPKSWSDGEIVFGSQLNALQTAITDQVNGNLVNSNINAAADIDPTKLDDTSTDDTAMDVVADPYDSEAQVNATSLAIEIHQLRYQIKALLGEAKWYIDTDTNMVSIASSITALELIPNGHHGRNVLRNGGFDAGTAADASAAGWSAVETSVLALAATELSEGLGLELNVTAHASTGAADGISQSLAGLKAGATYVFHGRFKPADSDDSGTIVTTGADTDLALTFDGTADGTTYFSKTGTFTVDASGTTVVLKVLLAANSDTVACDNFSVIELDAASRRHSPGRIVESLTSTTDGTAATTTWVEWEMDGGVTDCVLDVQVPGPGYYIRVVFFGNAEPSGSNETASIRLLEGATGVAMDSSAHTRGGVTLGLGLEYLKLDPTPGTVYTYTIQLRVSSGTLTPQAGAQGGQDTALLTNFYVEVLPYA